MLPPLYPSTSTRILRDAPRQGGALAEDSFFFYGHTCSQALEFHAKHYSAEFGGEAELTGIVKGAANGLGCQALAKDLGFEMSLEALSDATAAIGIARRMGLGKVRHISVSELWIQERVRGCDLKLSKVLDRDNPVDMLTKHIEKPTLHRLLPLAGLDWQQGRPEIAPTLTHAIVTKTDHIGHGLYSLQYVWCWHGFLSPVQHFQETDHCLCPRHRAPSQMSKARGIQRR